MDLLTFLRLGKRLRRLVTVFVLALRPRLANEYYSNGVNIYFEKKKDGGYSSLVLPAEDVIFKIPIVIRPAKAMPSRTISDSIKVNHNKDILYPFSFG